MNHMRSSQKNRNSRNKGGRNRSSGNVGNRVHESAGPEGKVRGTPQQVIEKYLQLARDAQTSGDRVVAENFLQHAEHYIRLLNAAMPPQTEDRRAQQGQGDGDDGGEDDQANARGHDGDDNARHGGRGDDDRRQTAEARGRRAERSEDDAESGLETIEANAPDESPVVDTPEQSAAAAEDAPVEDAPKPRRRTRRSKPSSDEVPAG
jgi:hypothetical protein